MHDALTTTAGPFGTPELPAMTEREAKRTNEAIKSGIVTVRSLLLDMRDRRGWLALGYESFEDYGKVELGYEKSYIYQLVSAATVQRSLGHSAIVESIPESQLRPLAKLSDEDRRAVWAEATATAEKEGCKVTAKAVQEAVDALEEAKRLSDGWRTQALTEKKARETAEAAAALKGNELRKLQSSVEASAETLAAIRTSDLKRKVSELEIDKAEQSAKLKAMRKEQDSVVERRTKEFLAHQQAEINQAEAQLKAIEDRIRFATEKLAPVDSALAAEEHHQESLREINKILGQLGLAVTRAFDADYATHLTDRSVPKYAQVAQELERGAIGIRAYLESAPVHQLNAIGENHD